MLLMANGVMRRTWRSTIWPRTQESSRRESLRFMFPGPRRTCSGQLLNTKRSQLTDHRCCQLATFYNAPALGSPQLEQAIMTVLPLFDRHGSLHQLSELKLLWCSAIVLLNRLDLIPLVGTASSHLLSCLDFVGGLWWMHYIQCTSFPR